MAKFATPRIGAAGAGYTYVGSQLDQLLEPGEDRTLKSRRDARSSVASKPAIVFPTQIRVSPTGTDT